MLNLDIVSHKGCACGFVKVRTSMWHVRGLDWKNMRKPLLNLMVACSPSYLNIILISSSCYWTMIVSYLTKPWIKFTCS